jgi:5'-methylthioadenosine phosphorylase
VLVPHVVHLAAADPFCPTLHAAAVQALRGIGEDVPDAATSVVIQGPRFSTRAESRWFQAAGADIVNMTQYPEAVLAAELGLGMVNLSFVTDTGAGAGTGAGADSDAADGALVLARMAAAQPRVIAAIEAIVRAVPDGYEPRELVPAAVVAEVLALAPTGDGTAAAR